jgi:hypothetical protein
MQAQNTTKIQNAKKEHQELWLKSNKVARAFRRGKPSVNVAFSALPKSVLK